MKTLIAIVVVAGVLGTAAGIYVWAEFSGALAPKRSFAELKALLKPHLRIYLPEGTGPFPAVLLFHGCGGARGIMDEYAEASAKAGVAGIVVDSLAPRGIGYGGAVRTVCTGMKVRGRERAGDVLAAIDLAREIRGVDPNRLAIAGWSHGGWSILDALAMKLPGERPHGLKNVPENPFKGVRLAILTYPFCGFPGLAARRGLNETGVPLDVLALTDDDTAKLADCEKMAEAARKSGATVRWETKGGLTHAFDEPDQQPLSRYIYIKEEADWAHQRFADKLQEAFAP